jgi:hypothetical protein
VTTRPATPSVMLAVFVVAAVFVPLPANGATEPQIEPYKLAALENRGWPPPAKWLPFVRPGECLAVRLPDEQSVYCRLKTRESSVTNSR